jgi:exodeoxyribonuclease VII small subunit
MAKAKSFNFGEAFEKLNKIVDDLEAGDVDLDAALKQYEEGLKLVQQCKKQLSQVENKVKVIKEKYGDIEDDE